MLIGGERPSINSIKDVYNVNSQAFRVIEEVRRHELTNSSKVVGFCTVLPLTKEAGEMLGRDELNGLQMVPRFVCGPKQRPHSLYIGPIGAVGPDARATLLGYLLGLIADKCQSGCAVFTRPTSRDGLRLARQYGFSPVSRDVLPTDLMRLYRLDVQGRPTKRRI